jgi:hypothetical protein
LPHRTGSTHGIADALAAGGAQVLPFTIDRTGLIVNRA